MQLGVEGFAPGHILPSLGTEPLTILTPYPKEKYYYTINNYKYINC